MIMKYVVPENLRHIYFNKKVIYCEIQKTEELNGTDSMTLYKVVMLNCDKTPNLFLNKELKKLNIIDRIKVKFVK